MNQPTGPIDIGPAAGDGDELDVRAVSKPQRHPMIFARFDALAVGESFVLVNSHDPKHLHQEFERDHPGIYDWTYLPTSNSRLFGSGSAGEWRPTCPACWPTPPRWAARLIWTPTPVGRCGGSSQRRGSWAAT